MKVAVIINNYDPEFEGISISVTRLIQNLSKNHEIHLIAGKNSNNKEDFLRTTIATTQKDNVYTHKVATCASETSVDFPWGLDNLLFAIKKLNEEYHFDVLHGYYLIPTGYVTVFASKMLGIPCVVGVRGNDIAKNYLVSNRFGWIRWTLENADYLTFLNQDLLDIANIVVPITEKSLVVMNSSYFPDANFKKKKIGKKIILGYVGDVKRKKGLIYLLDAIKELEKENLELRITGDIYKDEKPVYLTYVKKNRLSQKVKFLKKINHKKVSDRYNECDVIILPTISDGCPNVIFEAMFLRKAIISTKNPAITQILDDEKNALLVEERDSVDLSKAIKKLIKNPQLIEKLGEAAKRKIEVFSPRTEAATYEKIYKKIALKKRTP